MKPGPRPSRNRPRNGIAIALFCGALLAGASDAPAASYCLCLEGSRVVVDPWGRGCVDLCGGPGVPVDGARQNDREGDSGEERCFYRNRWISCREASRLEEERREGTNSRELVCERGRVLSPANPTSREIARCRELRTKNRFKAR